MEDDLDRTKRVRKLVVVGAALAVVGATVPAAHSQSADDQVVSASVASLIGLTAGADVALGDLDPVVAANNTGTGTFQVSSNVPYVVTVDSSDPTMVDGAETLASPLAMTQGVISTTSQVANAASTLIAQNLAALGAGSGDGTDEYNVNYLQPSSYAEAPGNYAITLTYTAGPPVP